MKKQYKPRASESDPAVLDYISLIHTGTDVEQNFNHRMIKDLGILGFAKIEGNQLSLHVEPETLKFTIKHEPGVYCLLCNKMIQSHDDYMREGDKQGEFARKHMAEAHSGQKSPDAEWPHGYKVLHGYYCRLDENQHKKYKARQDPKNPQRPFMRKKGV